MARSYQLCSRNPDRGASHCRPAGDVPSGARKPGKHHGPRPQHHRQRDPHPQRDRGTPERHGAGDWTQGSTVPQWPRQDGSRPGTKRRRASRFQRVFEFFQPTIVGQQDGHGRPPGVRQANHPVPVAPGISVEILRGCRRLGQPRSCGFGALPRRRAHRHWLRGGGFALLLIRRVDALSERHRFMFSYVACFILIAIARPDLLLAARCRWRGC